MEEIWALYPCSRITMDTLMRIKTNSWMRSKQYRYPCYHHHLHHRLEEEEEEEEEKRKEEEETAMVAEEMALVPKNLENLFAI